MINAGFREIRLKYRNDKAPSKMESKVLVTYPKLHHEYHDLSVRFEEFEKKLPGHLADYQAAVLAFGPVEKECEMLDYFFNKPKEKPPAGVEVPENLTSKDTNAAIDRAQKFDLLLKPIYAWNDNVAPLYKKWFRQWEDFYDHLDDFDEDVGVMFRNWKKGTVNIGVFDKDRNDFHGYVDELRERLEKFNKPYKEMVLSFNKFILRVADSFKQLNSVGDMIEKKVKKMIWHPDNIKDNINPN